MGVSPWTSLTHPIESPEGGGSDAMAECQVVRRFRCIRCLPDSLENDYFPTGNGVASEPVAAKMGQRYSEGVKGITRISLMTQTQSKRTAGFNQSSRGLDFLLTES